MTSTRWTFQVTHQSHYLRPVRIANEVDDFNRCVVTRSARKKRRVPERIRIDKFARRERVVEHRIHEEDKNRPVVVERKYERTFVRPERYTVPLERIQPNAENVTGYSSNPTNEMFSSGSSETSKISRYHRSRECLFHRGRTTCSQSPHWVIRGPQHIVASVHGLSDSGVKDKEYYFWCL